MKRWLFIITVLFVGVFLAGDLFSATYDLTGTWNHTLSDNWAIGGIECNPGPDSSGTCTIDQTGDTFTFAYTSGVVCNPPECCTFEGTVDGAVYTCSTTDIVDDEGGSVTSTIVFTASSATSASGSGTSSYTHPSGVWECNWGSNITLTKSEGGEPGKYILTTSTIGSGTVTLDPAGGVYDPGTVVQLTAVADTGWEFFGWTGDVTDPNSASTTVTMDNNKTVVVVFTQSGTAAGFVSEGPAAGAMLSLSEGTFEGTLTSTEPPGDAPANFPFGLIGFTIGELSNGATVTVVLTMPGAIPAGSVYYKYQNGVYTQYGNVTGLNDGDNSFTITLTDGGTGDADGAINGQIVDPGGPGLLTNLYFPHVDTNNGWETEIGIINKNATQSASGNLNAYDSSGYLLETIGITLASHARRQIIISQEFTNHSSIDYLIFDSDSGSVQGYTKLYKAGIYRAAFPAAKEINTSDIYVSHIASDGDWWTQITLLNTTDTQKSVTIEFNTTELAFPVLQANRSYTTTIRDLFGGPKQDIKSAVIKNASGIVGVELFGSTDGSAYNYLSGILLEDDTATTIYYPHIDSNYIDSSSYWWTGVVAYSPPEYSSNITVTSYTQDGIFLGTTSPITINANGKYIGSVETLDLPYGTAWIKIDSDNPITGFELFGTQDGKQLGGYTGVGISGKEGVFAKIEKQGWTGIAFVNIESSQATVMLTAYDNYGSIIATQPITLASYAKEVEQPMNIFTQDISAATYISYSSDKEIVAFQLNGSSDGMMLDGLEGM